MTDDCAIPIFDLVMAQNHGATLAVFARLGLFDYIHQKGDVSVKELASHAGWSIRATSAMLISLTTNHIVAALTTEDASESVHSFDQRYKLQPRAANFLRSDVPGSVAPYLELFWQVSPQQLLDKAAAKNEKDSVMLETGGGGAPSQMFIDAMQGQTSHAAMTLAPLLEEDLATTTHFVDVGGGSGTFCIEACKAFPNLKGSIYELQGVCPIAEKYIEKANLKGRVQAVPGNMFQDETFPAADCYAFGNVFHDWDDETNKALLQKAHKSMEEKGGKVILLEMLVAEDVVSTTRAAAGLNLVMVTNEDGRQYKPSELESMMRTVGFDKFKVVSSPKTPYSAVIAYKSN